MEAQAGDDGTPAQHYGRGDGGGIIGASILWRRLDVPGHDACRLKESDSGWRLEGAAVLQEEGRPACLAYLLEFDWHWLTKEGRIHGWIKGQSVQFAMARTDRGLWTLNGDAVSGLENCVDLDFGFTPATNLSQLRRVSLTKGQTADVPVAWLDVVAATLTVLPQRYERRSQTTYWYEAPTFDYEGLLEVDPIGFIRRYPGLWVAEL